MKPPRDWMPGRIRNRCRFRPTRRFPGRPVHTRGKILIFLDLGDAIPHLTEGSPFAERDGRRFSTARSRIFWRARCLRREATFPHALFPKIRRHPKVAHARPAPNPGGLLMGGQCGLLLRPDHGAESVPVRISAGILDASGVGLPVPRRSTMRRQVDLGEGGLGCYGLIYRLCARQVICGPGQAAEIGGTGKMYGCRVFDLRQLR